MAFWLTFFLWVASFVLQDYFRAKLPSQEPSGEGDFQSPTSTEGRKVPQVIGGTVKIKGPNTLFQGDWEAETVTIETGIIFKRDEPIGYRYKIGLALGQFQGRCAGMTAVYIGDDKVWDHVSDNAGVPTDVADINLPELFGGEKNGGGFVGRVRAFLGTPGQPVSAYLASHITNQSAWPGFVYVVITNLTETAGATIGEVNQLRDIRCEFQMHDTIAGQAGFPGLGDVLSLGNNHHYIGRDANPISASMRVLNDPDFLLNLGDINFTNFKAAAEICWTEGIGYSQVVDNELEAYEVLAEIEKHVDGYLGPNPSSGLLEWKLARQDYTPAAEFQATEANILKVLDYAKPEWPQTKNEVKIRFVNREKDYSDDHAVAQDMAGRIITGRPQSVTVRFPGLRDATAANAIVTRTSRAYFWPLSKFKLLMDRSAYALRPGDVVVVTHPDIAAVDLPTRITRISTGDPVKQTIKVDVVQDVFDAELGLQAAPQASEHVPASSTPVAVTQHTNCDPPRWMLEHNDQILETRLLFLVARDIPNTSYVFQYRSRPVAFSGNWTAIFDDAAPAFAKRGTLRADLIQLNATVNDGTAGVGSGGGFQLDGDLGDLVGTYDPAGEFNGLAVIDPDGANEEWIAVGTITINGAGIQCANVIRGLGHSPIRAHALGEAVWFVDSGAYMQANTLPDDTNNNYGHQYNIAPVAQGVQGAFAGLGAERRVDESKFITPYAPTALIFNQLGSTVWFPTGGTLDASAPNSITNPTSQGIIAQVWNRRWDQVNFVFGANSNTDLDSGYVLGAFSDVDPTLQWWIYDLDTTPNPTHITDAVASGELLSADDRVNTVTIGVTVFQGLGLPSGFNCRFEFAFKNTVTLAEVAANAVSKFVFMDKILVFNFGPETVQAISDTVLLLHMEGFDRTTQFIDYSPFNHTVTPAGDAQVDTDVTEDTGMDVGSLLLDSTGDWLEVADHAAFNLDVDPGFVIQARVRFTATPSGEIPIVTKWTTTGNQRQFWFGLNNTTLRFKHSNDGTAELIETTGTRTWNIGQWYEIVVCVWETQCYFFVDGAFDENQAQTFGAPFDGTSVVRIGADGDGNSVPAETQIDEVRIINNPIYKAPFTKNTVPLPGRERLKILHCNWENAVDADTAYNTDDLNRMDVRFPLDVTTEIDTAQSMFGTNSLYGDGTSGNGNEFESSSGVLLQATGPGDALKENWEWDRNTDFTMECFARFEVTPTAHTGDKIALIAKRFRGASPFLDWVFAFDRTSHLYFQHHETTALGLRTIISGVLSISIDTWYHCAVVRKDGVTSLFFDGNRVAQELTEFADRDFGNVQANVTIGRMHRNTSAFHWSFHGWLDEVRVQLGVAEYDGATYTIPTAAFPVDPVPEAEPPALSEPSNWQPTNL